MRFWRAPVWAARKPSKKNRSVGKPATESAASTDDAPGSAVTAVAGLASRSHQFVARVGNQRCARVRYQCDCLVIGESCQQLWPCLGGVVFVVGRKRSRYPVAFDEFAGNAGILAGDHISAREHLERAQSDVTEISDRRGDQIKARLRPWRRRSQCQTGHSCAVAHSLSFAMLGTLMGHRSPSSSDKFLLVFHTPNFRATKSAIPVTTDMELSHEERRCWLCRARWEF